MIYKYQTTEKAVLIISDINKIYKYMKIFKVH